MQIELARKLMEAFASRTGLTSDAPPKRYLWTDAFAVANYVAMYRESQEQAYLHMASSLVDQVHRVLGRHRPDDDRSGWISGLGEDEGAAHPTLGGLRVGKSESEQGRGAGPDEGAEWERDGQYFHYLTRWMHALDLLARHTGDARYHRWSAELAITARDAFVWEPGGGAAPRVYWKMDIALSRPVVASMGRHDALDGMVTAAQICDTRAKFEEQRPPGEALEGIVAEYDAMVHRDLATEDPLGLGGLLVDACRLAQLTTRAASWRSSRVDDVLEAASAGLQRYMRGRPLERLAEGALAFRQLGLAIGIEGVARFEEALRDLVGGESVVAALCDAAPLADQIIDTWRDPVRRAKPEWSDQQDINDVMLATALTPAGLLDLSPSPLGERD